MRVRDKAVENTLVSKQMQSFFRSLRLNFESSRIEWQRHTALTCFTGAGVNW